MRKEGIRPWRQRRDRAYAGEPAAEIRPTPDILKGKSRPVIGFGRLANGKAGALPQRIVHAAARNKKAMGEYIGSQVGSKQGMGG